MNTKSEEFSKRVDECHLWYMNGMKAGYQDVLSFMGMYPKANVDDIRYFLSYCIGEDKE